MATAVSVELVDRARPTMVAHSFGLTASDAEWSVTVPVAQLGGVDLYGFRVEGPNQPELGHRCDPAKVLLDPQATQVWFPPQHDRDRAKTFGVPTLGHAPLGVLRDDLRPVPQTTGSRHRDQNLVIYELHVRGATMLAEQVPAELRGTFAGLTHLAAYIADLGVTAIELLPIHQFDPDEGNYWGYMALVWGALHHAYVAGPDPEGEFHAMVQAFHDAGLEVLLDVVYNHTTEEDHVGPTYTLRGIDNRAYYVVEADGTYRNDAGCGNIVRAAHPAAARLIVESLRRYADLGVDGFRFDLGSLLGRDIDGNPQEHSALIDEITEFAQQRDIRLIAEPWDLATYQIGDAFPGRSWGQWNGKFRDDVRSFLRGEEGFAEAVALRVAGSPDLYGRHWARSINFLTAHDGFTLYDWASYERKHNNANGWDNNDGSDDNRSWNCGWEGDDIPNDLVDEVMALRNQQMRNALCMMLLSQGVPMLLAGDEWANTQHGNNNVYNQDNATAWLNWRRAADFSGSDRVRAISHCTAAACRGRIALTRHWRRARFVAFVALAGMVLG